MHKKKLLRIKDIIAATRKPPLYEPGTHSMWTDPYIAEQLLEIHLDEEEDLASRPSRVIEATLAEILKECPSGPLTILDLGCGPGLYTQCLARQGHQVTGIDFSESSIAYAREQAAAEGLDIRYQCADYRTLELPEGHYDLVIQIFTDFGVLAPADRDRLAAQIRRSLKPGGLFVLDVLNDTDWKNKTAAQVWEADPDGFWSETPYLHLAESHLYEDQGLILYQHTIVQDP